jgi:DNA-binding response OmpR family regulator
MTQGTQPVVLGVDEDRGRQAEVAQAFNEQGVFYRFITDRRKLAGGIKQLKPQLLVVFGELESDFVIQVLDALASDVAMARYPVVLVCADTSDAAFVQGLRGGVVSLLKAPFNSAHIGVVRAVLDELPSRTGTATGACEGAQLLRLVEHLRRTRRSGVLLTNPRTPNEGRAHFVYGRLERAHFLGANGPDAIKAMAQQPSLRWSFSEVAGSHSEGAGVMIEIGDVVTGEMPVMNITVGDAPPDDEPLAFEVPPAQPEAPAPPPPTPAVEAERPQLLLVDDDPAILKMFSTLFAKHGFNVVTAADGQQGADIARQRSFDVVLADLNMPHLDGWGMLRVLREDFRTRELPVSFLSAHDDYRESLRALDAGAQAYLSKGSKLDVIVGQVVKLLEPRRTMLALLDLGQTDNLSLHQVGPQWFLRQLAARGASGVLGARDGWATYQLSFEDGTCTHASAVAGKYTADGERAFNAFVASRAAEGAFIAGPPPQLPRNLFQSTEVLVERACSALNENEQRLRESMMVTATQVEVNGDLYAVYAHVGPKDWLEIARLICEEKMPAREVIGRLDVSPLDVEECMKDLIRRGVVTLKRA